MATPITVQRGPLEANFVDAPADPHIQGIHRYWLDKRGERFAPARADIKPAEMKPFLPYIMMWDLPSETEPRFIIRLVGSHITGVLGQDNTGRDAVQSMPPPAAAMQREIFSQVINSKEPRFRTGRSHWSPEKSFRRFEACFLPLSEDGESVTMILGGVSFAAAMIG